VIHLIVKNFFASLRRLTKRNEEINIQGFFSLNLTTHFKNKLKKEGKNTNLRRRKNKKQYYVKKTKK
jgi:hypothetical protein